MMFTKFTIVADEDAANYKDDDVIAVLLDDGAGWRDPHGGIFTDAEKSEFYEVAAGRQRMARLRLGPGRFRLIRCRLAASFA